MNKIRIYYENDAIIVMEIQFKDGRVLGLNVPIPNPTERAPVGGFWHIWHNPNKTNEESIL
jgi:hypothetical protein